MYPNLKIAIFKKGMHQNRISKVLGINEADLSKIIHGYREPSESQKRLLSSYLESDETWLFQRFYGGAPSRVTGRPDFQQNSKDDELNSKNR
jgi:transcriptional regulator with XRE-family HTH domain